MSVIKSIYGKPLDWSGLANVPAALEALTKLKGNAGQILSISETDAEGVATAFEAVEKPTGGEDEGQNVTIEPAEDDVPCVYLDTGGAGMPFTKDEGEKQIRMLYASKSLTAEYYLTAKVQGSSSASNPNYKKRNWTFKFYTDSTYEKKLKLKFMGWPEMNKFVLKAGWVIPGHLRNVGAAKIWGQIMRTRSDFDTLPDELRNSPNLGATDGFHVRVFVDGMYWGIYDWIVAKDQLFGQDKDNASHSILNSELNNQPTCAFATTSPTISGNWSEELLDSMTADTKTSMENWIKFVAGATDEEFVANAETYFDVQSVIDAICFDRILMTVDNMCRNQIVFKYDAKWYMGKWDLDAILGLPPMAGQTWYNYDTAYQEGYVAYKDYGIVNMLYKRTEELFLDRFNARYWELRDSVLSENNLVRVFGQLSDRLRAIDGLLAEENASATGNGEFTGMPNVTKDTIQQIREMVVKRCAYMDEVVEHMTYTEPVACTGITLSTETLAFDTSTTQTLTATVTPDGCTDPVTWESSDYTVASVAGGVVTPVGNGIATITARCGEYSATCSVSVSLSEVTPVNILADTVFEHGSVHGDTGESIAGGSDVMTGFVDVSAYRGKRMSMIVYGPILNHGQKIAFFDAEQNFISCTYVGTNTVDATVPDDATYARFGMLASATSITVVQVDDNVIRNVFSTEGAVVGSYYDSLDGTIKSYAQYTRNQMPVYAPLCYFNNIVAGAFFDSSDTFISGITHYSESGGRVVAVPENAAWFGYHWFTSKESDVVVADAADGIIGTLDNTVT